MKKNKVIKVAFLFVFVLLFTNVYAQVEYRWLAVGSLQNFYSNIGSEIEEGFLPRQQAGLIWPGIYEWQDAQAAKALWLGTTNWTDQNGKVYTKKVIHVGPRVRGEAYFFPISMEVVSKFEAPTVLVDGNSSARLEQKIDRVDPTQKADRIIKTKINTAIGVTIDRTISQFSQQYHDNYHLIEIVLTNTGNIDKDDDIELPNQTITGLYLHEQNRWAPVAQTRDALGGAVGWGINTMNDRRGDGLGSQRPDNAADPTESEFTAQFAWHGLFKSWTTYDNVGGPIWLRTENRGYLSLADTSGRLGAYHFVGKLHVYADSSATNKIAAKGQPSTMDEIESDESITTANDPLNETRMSIEYDRMSVGRTPRHAYIVEPLGNPGFILPTADPGRGKTGGYSAATGYGPYTLAPGESIKIVYAEAVSGIGHEFAKIVGVEYKNNLRANMNKDAARKIKNEKMFQGRDSLFQTFRNIKKNYAADFAINQPPLPPSYFEVTSTGAGIQLDWEYKTSEEVNITGFEVYRSAYKADSTAKKIATLAPTERTLIDGDRTPAEVGGAPIRGIDYYYYITAVGKPSDNADGILNPTGALRSSRYYTQTYDYARLLRQPGEDMSEIRIVPNPYISQSTNDIRFDASGDRIAFYDVPGNCTIKIFTEIGEFVTQLQGNNSGDIFWDLFTKSRQRIVSGIYIAVIENLDSGEKVTKKFVVIF